MNDPLLHWRAEFPTVEQTVHLISHSLGAMPKRTSGRLAEYAETWTARGIRAWEEGWWEMPRSVGDLIGKIVGAGPGEVAMTQNVSVCQSIVTSCFDWGDRRNTIVTDSLNFPSNLYIYAGLERQGARVVTIASEDGMTIPTDRWMEAIDERTRLVSVSHVVFRSSFVQNLAAITRRAHEVGAYVIADLYQSAGVLPLNVRELGVDFATGGSVKWLCGGPGAGYLYVRPGLWDRLQPAATGWMAHERPFAFEPEMRYAPDIFRFLNGTPNVPAMYAARSGYEIVNEIGVEAIRAKSVALTQSVIELADAAGIRVASPRDPSLRGGVVILDVPNGRAVTDELLRRDFLVDYRPGAGIRVGPHFYNTREELERLVAAIGRLTSEMPSSRDPG